MNNISRRGFLKSSMVAAVATGIAEFVPGTVTAAWAAAGAPHMTFPTHVHDRISVASWPFRAYIDSATNEYRDKKQPGMDLKDFAAMVRDKFGIHNIEPLGAHFRSTDDAYLHEFREAVEKAGSHVIDIPMGGEESYYDPDPAVRKQAVDLGKKWIDIATVVGSPSIRNHIGRAKSAKPDVALTAESLKQVADYGSEKNVVVNLENDDLVSEDAFFLTKVIDKVNSPWLRGLPDFCNSMLTGNAGFNYRAVTAMFKRAYNICHVKDSEVGDNKKVFRIDIPKTFGILKASGFRGYCSMEWEGAGDPYTGTKKLIDDTMKYLG